MNERGIGWDDGVDGWGGEGREWPPGNPWSPDAASGPDLGVEAHDEPDVARNGVFGTGISVPDPVTKRMLAFDPGGVHVGVSSWERRGPDKVDWRCAWSAEYTPTEVIDRMLDWITTYGRVPVLGRWRVPDYVAYETFHLRGGVTALAQTGKSFPEVELIGVIRAATRAVNIPFVGVSPANRAVAVKRARAAGYRWAARTHGQHARDAEAVAIVALDLGTAELSGAVAL